MQTYDLKYTIKHVLKNNAILKAQYISQQQDETLVEMVIF